MKLLAAGAAHDVRVIERADTRVRVAVDGNELELGVLPLAEPGTFRISTAAGTHTLHAVPQGDDIHVFWRGRAYVFRREGPVARRAAALSGTLEAPMPGRVVQLMVAVGDEVAAGQGLLILEAMKMENVVRAPRAGRVGAIAVEAGARVAAGQRLVEIE